MIMHELMEQLHGVESGAFDFERELAGEAAGAIEILQTKLNHYETLKQEGRLLIIPEFDVRNAISMDFEKTLQALRRMKVETGSLPCFGCGHEHNCGIHGCAILQSAVQHMEMLMAHYDHLTKLLDDQEEELRRFKEREGGEC